MTTYVTTNKAQMQMTLSRYTSLSIHQKYHLVWPYKLSSDFWGFFSFFVNKGVTNDSLFVIACISRCNGSAANGRYFKKTAEWLWRYNAVVSQNINIDRCKIYIEKTHFCMYVARSLHRKIALLFGWTRRDKINSIKLWKVNTKSRNCLRATFHECMCASHRPVERSGTLSKL